LLPKALRKVDHQDDPQDDHQDVTDYDDAKHGSDDEQPDPPCWPTDYFQENPQVVEWDERGPPGLSGLVENPHHRKGSDDVQDDVNEDESDSCTRA
jgi:hypothetical protein